jgi:hypothetical protein
MKKRIHFLLVCVLAIATLSFGFGPASAQVYQSNHRKLHFKNHRKIILQRRAKMRLRNHRRRKHSRMFDHEGRRRTQ